MGKFVHMKGPPFSKVLIIPNEEKYIDEIFEKLCKVNLANFTN